MRGRAGPACVETFDIGPFRFECRGHDGDYEYRAIRYHGGKVEHHSASSREVGDVELTWWTMAAVGEEAP